MFIIDNNSRSDQNTVTKKYLILYRFAKLKKGKKKKKYERSAPDSQQPARAIVFGRYRDTSQCAISLLKKKKKMTKISLPIFNKSAYLFT